MPRYVDNYVPPKYGDDTKPGGTRIHLDRTDPRFDDFSKFWKQKEEEKRKQDQSSGQGSSRGYSHN